MKRSGWDWHQLVDRAADVILTEIPAVASLTSRPIVLRCDGTQYTQERKKGTTEKRVFVFHNDAWFERHVGTASALSIVEYLQDLDQRKDWWVNTYVACDLSPNDVGDMDSEALVALLWKFAALRRKLRIVHDLRLSA
jgi:hypothetical protein